MPWNRAERLIDQAEELSDKGLYDTAHDLLQKALTLAPQHPSGHALLALNTWRQDKNKEAHQIVQTALELGPDWPYVHYVAGSICLSLSDTVTAEKHFREGIRLNNEYSPNFLGMAEYYEQIKKPKKALEYLDQALERNPEHVYALTMRGRILYDIGQPKKAESEARRALQINPEDYGACILMALIKVEQGKLDESRELAILALQQYPKDEVALTLLVQINSHRNPFLKFFWLFVRPINFLTNRFGSIPFYLLLIPTIGAFQLYKYSFGTSKIVILTYLSLIIGSFIIVSIGMLVIEAMVRREMKSVEIDADF